MRISDWSSDVCSSDLFVGECPSNASAGYPDRMTKRDSRTIDVEPLVPAIIRPPSPRLDYCQNLRREGFIELTQIDSVNSLRRADPYRRSGQMEGCRRLPHPKVLRDRDQTGKASGGERMCH